MKLIGKQIVVELPKKLRHISQVPPMDSTMRACGYYEGVNNTISEAAMMNPAWEVDVAKIEHIIKSNHILVEGQCDTDIFVVIPIKKLALALASNPSAWMKRKD